MALAVLTLLAGIVLLLADGPSRRSPSAQKVSVTKVFCRKRFRWAVGRT